MLLERNYKMKKEEEIQMEFKNYLYVFTLSFFLLTLSYDKYTTLEKDKEKTILALSMVRQYFLFKTFPFLQKSATGSCLSHMLVSWFNPSQQPSPRQPLAHSPTSRTRERIRKVKGRNLMD